MSFSAATDIEMLVFLKVILVVLVTLGVITVFV